MAYWILHIADPHFSRSHFHSPDPVEIGRLHAGEVMAVLDEYNLLRSPFDAIVLSGDFTFAYDPKGFEAAAQFVARISHLAPQRMTIVIPGNHDIDLSDNFPIGKLSIPIEKQQAESKFRSFLDAIHAHVFDPNAWLSMTLRLENKGHSGLVLLGMNSCRVERRDAQGWGYIGLDQVYEIGTHLVVPPAGGVAAKDGDVVIAITHHNLLPVWDLEIGALILPPGQRKLSFTVDAASVLHALNDLGVAALLHGHTHTISEKQVVGYGEEAKESTMVFGAGSLGFFHPDCMEHHIQVLEVDSDVVSIHDLTCHAHPRNDARAWARMPKQEVKIARKWKREQARRALKRMSAAAGRASVDWGIMESWSRLRAFHDTARWPGMFEEIYEGVHRFPGGGMASREDIAELIQTLFHTPPDDEELSGLPLQTYLFQRWQAKKSWRRLDLIRDPVRWPAVLEEIYEDIRRRPGGSKVKRERIAELIQNLVQTPPNAEEIAGITLQEYLFRRL